MAQTTYELTIDTADITGEAVVDLEIVIVIAQPTFVTSAGEIIIPKTLKKRTNSMGVATFDLLASAVVGSYSIDIGQFSFNFNMPASDSSLSDLATDGEISLPQFSGSGLPPVSASDNGKVLTVVSGLWASATLDQVDNLEIDARIAAWARTNSPSGEVPEDIIPSSIARDSEVASAIITALATITEGTVVLSGTRSPTASDGADTNLWIEGSGNGNIVAIWENVTGTWVELVRVADSTDSVRALQHLARDLHAQVVSPTWTNASDSDGDLYHRLSSDTSDLADSDFDNQGASVSSTDQGNNTTNIYIRLPAASDHTDFRLEVDSYVHWLGNSWTPATGPDTSTYQYWFAGDVVRDGGSTFQLQKHPGSLAKTRFDGALGGEAKQYVDDRVPPFPAEGSRDGKAPIFDGNTLKWLVPPGGGSGSGLTQGDADARYLRLAGGTLTGALTLHAAPTSDLEAATKKYVDDNSGGTDSTARMAAATALARANAALPKAGGTLTGFLTLHSDPTANKHAATKEYVDNLTTTGEIGAQAYAFYAAPTLVPPAVTTNQTIASSSDGYIHTLLDAWAAPAGIVANVDFITEWEGVVTFEVTTSCNLEVILRTKHTINSKEFSHERKYFLDAVGGTRIALPMSVFNSRSRVRPGTFGGVTLTADDIEAASEITYELEFQSFARKSSTTRNSNTLSFLGAMSIEVVSYQDGGSKGDKGDAGDGVFKNFDNFPSVANYEVGDILSVDDQLYELGVTDETAANLYEAVVGHDSIHLGDEHWRGVANSQSPNGFSTDGGFSANPSNAIALIMASDARHIRVAIKKSVFDTAKGSAFVSSDHLYMSLALESGNSDVVTMAYYNSYSRDTTYLVFQHKHASNNYHLYGEDEGHTMGATFRIGSNTGNLIAHAVSSKHWLLYGPADDDTALQLAQANQARLDALDVHVDGVTPNQTFTYDADNVTFSHTAFTRTISNLKNNDLIAITWENFHPFRNAIEHVLPGSSDAEGRMYFRVSDLSSAYIGGQLGKVTGINRLASDGSDDTLNSRLELDMRHSGTSITLELAIDVLGNANNVSMLPPTNMSLKIEIYRNATAENALNSIHAQLALLKTMFGNVGSFQVLTNAEYNALATKDAKRVYFRRP